MSDDDPTPVLRSRSSTSVTHWGIVTAWLAADQARRIEMLVGPEGLCVHVTKEGGHWLVELVAPHEDPSSACVRGIGKL